jgi:enoyl-CoA hydratase/carnithine racemase
MTRSPLALLQAEGCALLILDRPAVGNALSAELVDAMHAALDQVLNDGSTHTILLSGSGRHFCTGFDLGTLDAASDAELLARLISIEQLLDRLWRAPVRTAAVASGRCWGAGADLLAVCDQRIVTPDASFRFPGAGFGIVLGSRRLALRVGLDQARRLISQGETLDAAGALQAGLVTALFAPSNLPTASETVPASLPPAAATPGRAPADAVPASPAAAMAPSPAAPAAAPPSTQDGFAAHVAHCLTLLGPAPAIDRDTLARIRLASLRALEGDGQAAADADLAALVRSAARPGLQARIRAYRDRVQASRTRT